jgi:poly(A) polymerase/tRNA nucleotidyltransferase (CCA-adding enzyme)
MKKILVPKEVAEVCKTLTEGSFEAYLVGGCVRDMLLGREPKDWDVATNAKPAQVQKLFKDTVYENDFGTVGVKTESEDSKLKVIEVTTYRIEGKYTDKRHPDEVKFAKKIEEDLARRDFTVNALAMDLKGEVIDPYGGKDDLAKKMIRTVGNPEERFSEDALRLMRAVRFAVELDFEIEKDTRRAIGALAGELEMIAKERIREELIKMIMTPNAAKGIILLEELGLLKYVLSELQEGLGVGQNKHHIYTVFEHNVRALDYSAKQNYSLVVRMASLLHDVGKPRAKQGDGPNSSFHQHEYIGAKMAVKALDRLRFPKDFIEEVAHLVRRHMFYYNVGEISPAGVRRFVVRVGPEHIDDLLKVREGDRIGSGVEKAVPYKLRHLLFMIEKVKQDPILPKMLTVRGEDVMELLKIKPSPKIGWILNALLEEVLDDPEKNEKEYLSGRVKALGKLSDAQLKKLAESAKEKKSEFEEEAEEGIKKKFHVK